MPDYVAPQLSKVTWAKWLVWCQPDIITGRPNTAGHWLNFWKLPKFSAAANKVGAYVKDLEFKKKIVVHLN